MGATHVTVTIRNPADPGKSWEGLFLVDSGAIDSLVPKNHLEAIGVAKCSLISGLRCVGGLRVCDQAIQ